MITATESRSSLLRGHRNGLTLIEVVVGLAIAGTLLAATIMSVTAQRRQLKHAHQKQQAIALIDDFLVAWTQGQFESSLVQTAADSCGLRLRDDGPMDVNAICLQVRSVDRMRELELEVVRVEAYVGMAELPISWIEIVRKSGEDGL